MKTTVDNLAGQFDPSALLEAAVLAAPWAFGMVAELLHPEDFSDRANREIYVALLAMHAAASRRMRHC